MTGKEGVGRGEWLVGALPWFGFSSWCGSAKERAGWFDEVVESWICKLQSIYILFGGGVNVLIRGL